MKFCDWLPFKNVQAEAPIESGIFQIKIKSGLIDYPTGKSAMFYYGYTNNLNHGLEQFQTKILPDLSIEKNKLVVRWLVAQDTTQRFKKHLNLFLTKFGILPKANELLLQQK